MAATEFAIVVPFMLLLYVGGVELADGMAINVKVSATAHSVADMVTQNTSLSTAQMQNILTGATTTIAPYPVSNGSTSLLTVTVSEISSDATGKLTLQWSRVVQRIKLLTGEIEPQQFGSKPSDGSPGLPSFDGAHIAQWNGGQCKQFKQSKRPGFVHSERGHLRLYTQSRVCDQRDRKSSGQLLAVSALFNRQPGQLDWPRLL